MPKVLIVPIKPAPAPKPSRSSKMVTVTYKGDKEKPRKLAIKGRPAGILVREQGDHVTAFALIEEGIKKAISDVTESEISKFYDYENRDLLKSRRKLFYEFVSKIAALDPKKRDSLYVAIDKLLEEYNKKRPKKTELSKSIKEMSACQITDKKYFDLEIENIKKNYNEASPLIMGFMCGLANIVLVFYNHIAHTAYYPIEGFKAPSDEGANVKKAKKALSQEEGSDKPDISKIAQAVNDLIFYPYIKDDKLIINHNSKFIDKGTRIKSHRANDSGDLIARLSHHLHVVFAAYPKFEDENYKQDIIDGFLTFFLKDYPSDKFNFNEIQEGVCNSLSKLKADSKKHDYSSFQKSRNQMLDSSDDEDIDLPEWNERMVSSNQTAQERLDYILNLIKQADAQGENSIPNSKLREVIAGKVPELTITIE